MTAAAVADDLEQRRVRLEDDAAWAEYAAACHRHASLSRRRSLFVAALGTMHRLTLLGRSMEKRGSR